MSFAELKNHQLRLLILQLLAKDTTCYEANEGILRGLLMAFGHGLSRDALRTQLAWLAEQGLITVTTIGDSLQVAKLTIRGEDAAYGRALIPGVKRPGPEDSI